MLTWWLKGQGRRGGVGRGRRTPDTRLEGGGGELGFRVSEGDKERDGGGGGGARSRVTEEGGEGEEESEVSEVEVAEGSVEPYADCVGGPKEAPSLTPELSFFRRIHYGQGCVQSCKSSAWQWQWQWMSKCI